LLQEREAGRRRTFFLSLIKFQNASLQHVSLQYGMKGPRTLAFMSMNL
jgi:hypothetical protein